MENGSVLILSAWFIFLMILGCLGTWKRILVTTLLHLALLGLALAL
jgi:hypothetical protein